MFRVQMTWKLNSFSSFEQYSFPGRFRKEFEKQCATRDTVYCHSDISSNITNATHFSMPPTLPTLAHHHAGTSPYCHVTLWHAPRNQRWHLTPGKYQRKHTTHASTPPTTPTLAQTARHFSNSWISNTARHFSNSWISN